MDENLKNFHIIITVIISVFGLFISWLSFQKARFEVFNEFNKRYDVMNENLNLIKNGLEIKNGKAKDEIINDYIILCAEEYHWRWRFLISCKVWENWKIGIEYFFECEQFHDKIREEYRNKNSYYGFFDSRFFKSLDKKYKIIKRKQ